MKLSKELTKMIKKKVEGEECLQMFDNVYGKKCPFILARYFRHFLNTSIEREHIDLIELLLNDSRCNLDTPLFSLEFPLFVAIRSSVDEVMDVFLRESPPIDVTKLLKNSYFVCGIMGSNNQSPLQYACCFAGFKMLRKLLSYDVKQTKDRALSHQTPQLSRASPPIHNIMIHLGRRYNLFYPEFNLHEIITLMMDIGIDVNEVNQAGETCLDSFVQQIGRITLQGVRSWEHPLLITDVAKLLMSTHSRIDSQMMGTLITSLVGNIFDIVSGMLEDPDFHLHENQLALIADIIEIVVNYGDDFIYPTRVYPIHALLVIYSGHLAKAREKWNEDGYDNEDMYYDERMNSLCKMFRVLLYNSSEDNSGYAFPIADMTFIDAFVYLAGYSSEPGRSSQMIKLALTSMTISELKGFLVKLTALRNAMAITDSAYVSTTHALSWVQKTLDVSGSNPFSLKHLARHVILRSIPYQTLSADPSALGLPPCLRTYILSYDAGFEYEMNQLD